MTTTATSLIGRLNMTFTNALFAQAIDPNNNLSTSLNQAPKFFNTVTQYQALVTSNTSTNTYYKNPLAPFISSLTNITTQIYSIIVNANDGEGNYLLYLVPNLTSDYSALMVELTEDDDNTNGTPKAYNTFISHTDRLSRLKNSNKKTRPDFNNAASVARQVQTLIYQFETTSTNVVGPIGLGYTTSLFVVPQLKAYIRQLQTSLDLINSSIGAPASPTLISAVTTASTAITNLGTYLVHCRTKDEDFYQNATQIIKDASNIAQLTAGTDYGSTTAYDSQTYITRALTNTTSTSNLY